MNNTKGILWFYRFLSAILLLLAHPGASVKSRSPCRVFIWDVPSAIRFHTCRRLLKQSVYEGLGGKKFVRIKPNSILESLYPLHRHGPDRCLLCGHSFLNHLNHWWFSNLYSPYDMHLDHVYDSYSEEVPVVDPQYTSNSMKFSKNRKRLERSQVREPDMVPYRQYENNLNKKYVYHRRYVNEVTKDSDKSKQKKEKLKKSTKSSNSTFTHHLFNISYEVPIQQLREKSARNILSTLVIRSMVLLKLDSLIILEEIENNWNGWKRLQAV